jgi:hypothetical protein
MMRIKTFFFLAIGMPTLLCTLAGSWILSGLWQTYDSNGLARHDVEALRAVSEAVEIFAVQRGNINV